MMSPSAYTILITEGMHEGEFCFKSSIKELPDVAEFGDSYSEVYELAIDAIETTAEIMASKGRPMPAPMNGTDDFSGRITLRVPKTLHQHLVQRAEDDGISLNQQIVNTLIYDAGVHSGYSKATDTLWNTASVKQSAKAETG